VFENKNSTHVLGPIRAEISQQLRILCNKKLICTCRHLFLRTTILTNHNGFAKEPETTKMNSHIVLDERLVKNKYFDMQEQEKV
jgi:hypothetical protein